jgi:hypothetical protein
MLPVRYGNAGLSRLTTLLVDGRTHHSDKPEWHQHLESLAYFLPPDPLEPGDITRRFTSLNPDTKPKP